MSAPEPNRVPVFSSDRFTVPLPEGHRFPMGKYRLLRRAVEESDLVPSGSVRDSPAATDEDLLLVHSARYLENVERGTLPRHAWRRIGFPWSPELVERSRRSVGGTIAACRAALADGIGISLAGGTHHAFAERGEGFCLFNDVAVAARVVQRDGEASTVLVLDLDVHQGNGTAAIFAGDPAVFTCSIHGRSNFPYRKEESDLDVELEDGTGDAEYLQVLGATLAALADRVQPDLAVFLAGVDPFAGDRWGRLALSAAGLAARDEEVVRHFRARGVPLAIVMAGGYARDSGVIAALHLRTVEIAAAGSAGSTAPCSSSRLGSSGSLE